MSEMIERVAKAMQEACEGPAGELETGHYLRPHVTYVKCARVAIEAMREPTKAIEAQSWSEGFAGDLWRQMIDTALTDDKK